MPDLKKTLEVRDKEYGSYGKGAHFRAEFMKLVKDFHKKINKTDMKEVDYLCIFDIVNKLSRVVANPSHLDTWHDIAGYATIIEKFYKEKEDANKQ